MKPLFPDDRPVKLDYVIASAFIAICSMLFLHVDLHGSGLTALNFIFGDPLELYDNCKQIPDCWRPYVRATYPPPIYAIYGTWLYPFKLVGLITTPAQLPLYLTYWLKLLTTAIYIGSGVIFYRVCLESGRGRDWAKYAAAAYLTAPLALFSQAIISQNDIFHVALTITAVLMILRKRLVWASVLFGVSITFKYFPAFVFVPLLLLHEKHLGRLALLVAVFGLPLLITHLLYQDSLAFVEAVRGNGAMYRIFGASLDVGGYLNWRVYGAFAMFAMLCAAAYCTDLTAENRYRVSSFYWMAGSILPFLFMVWLPYWLLTVVPAAVLTTMLSRQPERHLRMDLFGMFVYVAVVVLAFQNDSDAAMFRGELLGMDFSNTYLMARLFRWFGTYSANIYLSLFWAYLALQILLKSDLLWRSAASNEAVLPTYGILRQRLYLGLAMFLLPAMFAVYQDQASKELSVHSGRIVEQVSGRVGPGRRLEQSFIASAPRLKRVALYLSPLGKPTSGLVAVEIVDPSDSILGTARASAADFNENAIQEFHFNPSVAIKAGVQYRLRLTCLASVTDDAFPSCATGDGLVWVGSSRDSYPDGNAIVDGVAQKYDFSFRVTFEGQ